jgi:tRNA (guanine-N7-)-methyltransferase
MQTASRAVTSSQTSTHKNLSRLVKRHLKTQYQQPVRNFNLEIFKQINAIKNNCNKPVILDSGCGTGDSTRLIAKEFPSCLVIGIDKSSHRLRRSGFDKDSEVVHADNYLLARTDIIDFWRLASAANWQCQKHYILYPNPWPKPSHLGRRWHAHPVFPFLISLGGLLELRTNWKIYAQEFSTAIAIVTDQIVTTESYTPESAISPFEKKYSLSGHDLYRCKVNLVKP